MNSAGQGNVPRPAPAGPRLDDGGYILVVLLIGMAVTAVWMGSLLPSWHQQATRERESELIFRGEQYARAIALYRRKNGTLPPNIDVLVSQHYLRRKYLDPITGKDFMPLGGVQAVAPSGFAGNSQSSRGNPPQTTQSSMIQGGITGVRSTSNDQSIKVYYNQTTYSQWPFDWTTVAARRGDTSGMNPNTIPDGRGGRGGRGGPPDELSPILPGFGRGTGGRGGPPGGPGSGPPRGTGPSTSPVPSGPSFGGRGQ